MRLIDNSERRARLALRHGLGAVGVAKGGEVRYELFEDVGTEAATAIESTAQRLQEWLGEVVVTPRFRSPNDTELANR